MEMKEAITKYLDGQVKQDAALAEKYVPEHIGLCIDYINAMGKKVLGGKSGVIDDPTVYKWSRDFWLEGHLEEALKKKEEKEKKKKEDDEKWQKERKDREEKRQKEKLAGKEKKASVKKKDKDGKKAEKIADKSANVPPEKTEDKIKPAGPAQVTEEPVSQAVQTSLFGED
jgi:hypothetical protein